ncbi:MAG: diguanylate cyclase [Lysobacterales bacterium]
MALGLALTLAVASVAWSEDLSLGRFDPQGLLRHADAIKTTSPDEFERVLGRLRQGRSALSESQIDMLDYLEAFRRGFKGDYDPAYVELKRLADAAHDPVLRFRANSTLINLLTIARRYQEAFVALEVLTSGLPSIVDTVAREQGLAVAMALYVQVDQLSLGLQYAEQLIAEAAGRKGACSGWEKRIEIYFKQGALMPDDARFASAIEACTVIGEWIFAGRIRANQARQIMKAGRFAEASALLEAHYQEAEGTRYPRLVSEFDALLALAYWHQGRPAKAESSARAAIGHAVAGEFTEPLVDALRILYEIKKTEGDSAAALDYHERYMAADKAWLNDVSARQLAFQLVQQQTAAKQAEIETLNRQNNMLALQRDLKSKSAESAWLYAILLAVFLAALAFWALRTKRSQLHFRERSERDSLTGIANRQHFVEQVQLRLAEYAQRGEPAAILLLDLDHFKRVNDVCGHVVGDQVLMRMVAACCATLHTGELFGRIGGEEFGILLGNCGLSRAGERAEAFRVAVAAIAHPDLVAGLTVTVSIGVASSEQMGYHWSQLMAAADAALYRAKHKGRNRVELVAAAAQP